MRIGILLFQFVRQILWLHAKPWAIIWRKQVEIMAIICLVFFQFLSCFSMNHLKIFQITIIIIHFSLMYHPLNSYQREYYNHDDCWMPLILHWKISLLFLYFCFITKVVLSLYIAYIVSTFAFFVLIYSLYILWFILCSWGL